MKKIIFSPTFLLLVLLVYSSSPDDKLYYIINPSTNLVLEATNQQVQLGIFTRENSQLWKIKDVDGKSIIINEANGRALDISNSIKKHNRIITWPSHGEANQRWIINSDGTIVSDGLDPDDQVPLAVQINNVRNITAEPLNNQWNQQFLFILFITS